MQIQNAILDLDGTLLNAKKELTPVCRQALESAADAGILIVPATGRFFDAMPEAVRALPFLRYAITINGAQALDIQRARSIYRAEIPCRQAIEIMSYLDALPVIYDCYMNDCGWMTRSFQQQAETFTPDPYSIAMIRELRRKLGTSMIMITHDLGIVAEVCDTVAVIYAGEVVEYGTREQIFDNPQQERTRAFLNATLNK